MKRFALSLFAFALLGCAATQAQTIAERKTALKTWIDSLTDAQVPAVQTALQPLGYAPPTSPPPTDRRLIFATAHETGAHQLGGWSKHGNVEAHTQPASVSIMQSSFAHSGNWLMKTDRSGNGATRVFVHDDYTSGSAKNLPNETYATIWMRLPKVYDTQWLYVLGWKQTPWPNYQTYNEPCTGLHFQGPTRYLGVNVRGRAAGAATAGSIPPNYFVEQPTATRKLFPIDQWVQVVFYARHSTGNDGKVTVWQDGTKIIDYSGRTMRDGAPRLNFQVCNYAAGEATTIYYDDFTLEAAK